MNKLRVFEENYPSNKQLTVAIITTVGFKNTLWSEELSTQTVLLDDLFR